MGLLQDISRLEARIHTPEWRAAVAACRERLRLPVGDEEALNRWMANTQRTQLIGAIGSAYQELRYDQHLSARFLRYFGSCVLSDHGGGTYPHSLPEDLMSPNCLREPGRNPDPYFRHWHWPVLPTLGPGRWQPVAPPLGFELCWPKLPLLQVLSDPSGEVEIPRFSLTISPRGQWSWEVIDNYAILYADGRLVDGPYLYGPPLAGRNPKEFLSLPDDATVFPTRAVVPMALVPGLAHGGSLGPGAVLQPGEPFVQRDPMLEHWESRFADQAEASMRRLWLAPRYQATAPGRPRADTGPAPGASYAQRVQELYATLLRREKHSATDTRRVALRAQARRQAQREYPDGARRDNLPKQWWRLADEADRQRRRGATP